MTARDASPRICDASNANIERMRIVFLGTGAFAVPALRALHAAGVEIGAVVSQPDRPAGRGRRVRPTPVHEAADQLGLPHVQTDDVNAPDLRRVFEGAQLGVVAAFGQKLSADLLAAVPDGFVNIHASLLPRYRGAAPIAWAILNGDAATGVTVFRLNERWDAGPILASESTPIGEQETADELHDRLARMGARLVVRVVRDHERGSVEGRPQDAAQATRAPKLSRADGWVDFGESAFRVQRRIHGLWSWPAAACWLETPDRPPERVQLARAARIDDDTTPTPQRPAGAFTDDLTVQCGRGRIRLLEVRPAGGKLMSFDAFARGRRIGPGARLRRIDVL